MNFSETDVILHNKAAAADPGTRRRWVEWANSYLRFQGSDRGKAIVYANKQIAKERRRNPGDEDIRRLERLAHASGWDIAAWADYESAARRTGSSQLEAKVLAGGDVMDWLLFSAVMNRLGLSLLRPEYEEPLRAALAPVEGRDPSGRRVEVPREHWGQLQVLWKLRTDLEDARLRREFPLMNVIDQRGLKGDVYRLSDTVAPREPGDEIDGSRGNYVVEDRLRVTDYWYPSGLSSGHYSGGDARTRSNRAFFLDRFSDIAGVHPVSGSYGFESVGIRLDVTNQDVINAAIASLDGELDAAKEAQIEQEERDEAWNSWIKADFKRELSRVFGDVDLDEVEDSALRSFFDTYVNAGDWSSSGQGAEIRVDDVIRRVSSESLDDLLSPPSENPRRNSDERIQSFLRVVKAEPENFDAWEKLESALKRAGLPAYQGEGFIGFLFKDLCRRTNAVRTYRPDTAPHKVFEGRWAGYYVVIKGKTGGEAVKIKARQHLGVTMSSAKKQTNEGKEFFVNLFERETTGLRMYRGAYGGDIAPIEEADSIYDAEDILNYLAGRVRNEP